MDEEPLGAVRIAAPSHGDRPVSRTGGGGGARTNPHNVLLVEDNAADVFLVRQAISSYELGVQLQTLKDGEEAIRWFDRMDVDPSITCPELVLLDLNLPKSSGEEVLAHIRRSKRGAQVPVLIVTSSDSQRERAATRRLGVVGYFRKPSNYDLFLKLGELIRDVLAGGRGDPPR